MCVATGLHAIHAQRGPEYTYKKQGKYVCCKLWIIYLIFFFSVMHMTSYLIFAGVALHSRH